MIRLLLIRFWPVLIPFAIYFLWLFYVRRKATDGKKPRFGEGPFLTTVTSTVVVLIVCFAYYFLAHETKEREYIPARFEDGKLIQGTYKDKDE